MQPQNLSNLLYTQGAGEAELLNHPILEALPLAVYTCDANGYIRMYNKAAAELWGREPGIGTELWCGSWQLSNLTGEPLAPGESPMANVLRGQAIVVDEKFLIRRPDGTRRIVTYHPNAILDVAGKLVGAVSVIKDLTFEKDAEENVARLAAIVQSSEDAIVSKTLHGIVTSWNASAERVFGYTAAEMIGEHISKLIPPERIEEEPEILSRIQRGERVEHFDTQRVKKSGELIDISLTISPIRNSSGTIIGAAKIARDITLQKKLNKALQDSEERFRNLVMQAPVGITILKGRDLVVEIANRYYLEMVDRRENDFVGKKLLETLPELEGQGIRELLHDVLATGTPYYGVEFAADLNRNGNKQRLYFNFTYQPLVNEEGRADRILVIVNDVTKSVEDKHAIAESEKVFRKLVMESPIPMTIFRGKEHVIEMANHAMYEKIWRRPEKDVIGRKVLDVFPELKEQKFPAIMQEVLQTGKPHGENEALVFVTGTDGTRKFYLDYQYVPLFETDGSVSGIMITVNDVTEKVESRQRVMEAEQSTRLAVDAAELGTFDWILESNRFTSSQRLNDIFGYRGVKEISHLDLINRVHPDDRAIRDRAVEESWSKGSLSYVVRIIWPDESIHWVKVYGKVAFDKEGNPKRMYGTAMDVTEEKQTLKALAENEERLNIAVEAAEMGTWELNLITREPLYSERYLSILGFEPGSKPDHPAILSKIHPDDMGIRNEAIKKAMEEGTLDFEMRICPSRDIVRWIRSRGKVFYDREGVPQRILGTTLDITDQKVAFDILLQSEERFKAIANTAPVMIWMTGNEKYAGFHNTSWLNFTGIKHEHGYIHDWTEAVHPDDLENYLSIYENAYRNQEPFHREYRLRRFDGQYRWISDHAVPRYDNHNNFIGFISACMDIDDEKSFNERLRASELLFKTIANVSPVALWMTDDQGRNNFVNETWLEWTGKPMEEHMDDGWLSAVVDSDRQHVIDICTRSLQRREHFLVEFRLNRKDGQVRWMVSEGGPYYSIEKEFCGLAGSVADITERKQQEMQKNDFLAVASHELKTPITSIKAYTQLLGKTFEKTDNDFVKNALVKMENQVNKMTKLVSDFLKLSKIESGKFQLDPEMFDINELVREIAGDIQMVSSSHRIAVNTIAPSVVNADRERVSQVITNFLNNAVKYSPDNKDILVNVIREDDSVKVMVQDRGIGIRKEEHQKIFERFYRANGSANTSFSGFGIGLYISAEIIRKHGGRIGVDSEEGKGSCFYFALPLAN